LLPWLALVPIAFVLRNRLRSQRETADTALSDALTTGAQDLHVCAVGPSPKKTPTSSPGVGTRNAFAEPPPQLYPQRWVQLGYVSLLALLSDWVCFSSAAAPDAWVELYGRAPEALVDVFFLANMVGCCAFTDIADYLGLRTVVVGSAWLMAVGCLLRSGLPFGTLPSYELVVAGTVLVGLAQPFFLCSPPLLSDTWFGAQERTMATAISLNFNQVGVAGAFLVGGLLVPGAEAWAPYSLSITSAATVLALGCSLQFRDRPESPPSASTAIREAQQHAAGPLPFAFRFPSISWSLLVQPGFRLPLLGFVAAVGVANVISTFMDPILRRVGFADAGAIGIAGALFQVAMVAGGIAIGGLVDRNKQYKRASQACFLVATSLLAALAYFTLDPQAPVALVVLLLIILGAALGAAQPINAELSVEATYPADENALEAVSQLWSNGATAALVPICGFASSFILNIPGQGDVTGDFLLLLSFLVGTGLVYSTFNSPLKRSAVDSAFPLRPPD
jgi:FLVCR family MFS transporter 7